MEDTSATVIVVVFVCERLHGGPRARHHAAVAPDADREMHGEQPAERDEQRHRSEARVGRGEDCADDEQRIEGEQQCAPGALAAGLAAEKCRAGHALRLIIGLIVSQTRSREARGRGERVTGRCSRDLSGLFTSPSQHLATVPRSPPKEEMPVHRALRVVLIVLVALVAIPAATVSAAPRMQIGFYDDPSFRWSSSPSENLAQASRAGASIIHTTADWSQLAPTRPTDALDGDDPAYKLDDLDALVRNASRYGLQVFVNISQTPKWANGNTKPNHLPKRLGDLTAFSHMLASRYNGSDPARGSVATFSIWNEPNLELFLTPQYVGKKIVGPLNYAKLYKAGYAGIKAGNRNARVAIGETSARGRDIPKQGVSASIAPGTFAKVLARVKGLRFDAWAHHPYPTSPNLAPTQKVRYPNVTLLQLPTFEKQLNATFHRRVPIWVTEYGHQTKPELRSGVTRSQQAAYARTALKLVAKDANVQMFVWFILRDNTNSSSWKSGLYSRSGSAKPALGTFSATARLLDGQTVWAKSGRVPRLKVYVPLLSFYNAPGSQVGLTYRIFSGRSQVAVGQPTAGLAADQSITFAAQGFAPKKGSSYTATVDVGDAHGNHTTRALSILGV